MFRQILFYPDDWNLQHIVWIKSEQEIRSYNLTTVLYGTRADPLLAGRGRYVNDINGGADSLPQLINIAQQLNELCMVGGFPLAQCSRSNHPDFLPKFYPTVS